jgi:hypothetical protein
MAAGDSRLATESGPEPRRYPHRPQSGVWRAQRILPDGFHSIRHYGLFANGRRVENIAHVRQLLNVPAPHNEGGGADCAGDGEPQTLAYPCPG